MMTNKNSSLIDRENLSAVKEINNTFEQLLQQMNGYGYHQTRFMVGVAQKSFHSELFSQIKKSR